MSILPFSSFLGKTKAFLLTFLFPPLCPLCRTPTGGINQALCASCFKEVHFLSAPLCSRCGISLPLSVNPHGVCGHCMADPPPFKMARAVLVYNEDSKSLILSFKHGDRIELAPLFADWLLRAGKDVLQGADYLIPVPLHRKRLWFRRYNQAALLGHALAPLVAVPCRTDVLLRPKATQSQGRFGRIGRQKNIAGAFAVAHKEMIKGRNLVLIDDVLTTGATVSACAKALTRAGAASVSILTLARVPQGEEDSSPR